MKFVVIKAKDWKDGSRVVLTAVIHQDTLQEAIAKNLLIADEYTTHIQVEKDPKIKSETYLISGHYFQTLEKALKDFRGRD